MKITYDRVADAAYVYLSHKVDRPETRCVDEDIALDFDASDRLVGIEVLGASKRLDLDYLFHAGLEKVFSVFESTANESFVLRNGVQWDKLRLELLRMKKVREPVLTEVRQFENWVEEVGDNYVILRRKHGQGKTVKVTRRRLEGGATRPYVIRALRRLARSL